jgi:hypothetical protein
LGWRLVVLGIGGREPAAWQTRRQRPAQLDSYQDEPTMAVASDEPTRSGLVLTSADEPVTSARTASCGACAASVAVGGGDAAG